MNIFYTAYTRQIQGTNFYFVKKFSTFPELKGIPDILESIGMHRDFKIACRIAKINDPLIQQNLLSAIDYGNSDYGKIIHMNSLSVIKAAQ